MASLNEANVRGENIAGRVTTKWKRIILGGVATLPLVVCLLIVFLTFFGMWLTDLSGMEPTEHVQLSHGRIVVYRTGGGATNGYGTAVRYERLLLPGVLYVHYLVDVYPERIVNLRVLANRQVEVDVPPNSSDSGQTIRFVD
jgi:hypothetical protein